MPQLIIKSDSLPFRTVITGQRHNGYLGIEPHDFVSDFVFKPLDNSYREHHNRKRHGYAANSHNNGRRPVAAVSVAKRQTAAYKRTKRHFRCKATNYQANGKEPSTPFELL
jgi:hypothetical protein